MNEKDQQRQLRETRERVMSGMLSSGNKSTPLPNISLAPDQKAADAASAQWDRDYYDLSAGARANGTALQSALVMPGEIAPRKTTKLDVFGTPPSKTRSKTEYTGAASSNASQSGNGLLSQSASSLPKAADRPTYLVADRINGLISQDSDYMKSARTTGLQHAASRGLLNSSVSARASQGAAIQAAFPIASQDATALNQRSQSLIDNEHDMGRLGYDWDRRTSADKERMGHEMSIKKTDMLDSAHKDYTSALTDINTSNMTSTEKIQARGEAWDFFQQRTSTYSSLASYTLNPDGSYSRNGSDQSSSPDNSAGTGAPPQSAGNPYRKEDADPTGIEEMGLIERRNWQMEWGEINPVQLNDLKTDLDWLVENYVEKGLIKPTNTGSGLRQPWNPTTSTVLGGFAPTKRGADNLLRNDIKELADKLGIDHDTAIAAIRKLTGWQSPPQDLS